MPVIDLTRNVQDVDWIRAARLAAKAKKGGKAGKEAARKLLEMEETPTEEWPEGG